MSTIIFLNSIFLLSSIYLLIRLYWIKKFQIVLFMRSPDLYRLTPSLSHMLFIKFWDWREASFLPDAEKLQKLRQQ